MKKLTYIFVFLLSLHSCQLKTTPERNSVRLLEDQNKKKIIDTVSLKQAVKHEIDDVLIKEKITSKLTSSSMNESVDYKPPNVVSLTQTLPLKIGQDSLSSPKKTRLKGIQKTINYSHRVFASPMRMKDNSTLYIQYLDVDQGLNASNVLSVLEDKDGNLWFGTKGNGVSRYNGRNFIYFTKNEGLCGNDVWDIIEDKQGNIWFGTNEGLTKFDGKYFTNYTVENGLSGNYIMSLLEDKQGNIWIGTNENGVMKFDGEFITTYTTKQGLKSNKVYTIYEDKQGAVWFGMFGGGVAELKDDKLINYTVESGLININIWSICEANNGDMWFGTANGVSVFDGQRFFNYTLENGLSNNYVLSIIEDANQNMWLSTFGGGVTKFDGTQFSHIDSDEGLSNNYVWDIIEDHVGNIWFCTKGGGVNKYNGNSFLYFTKENGLSDNNVTAIFEDDMQQLWFGTFGEGLSHYDGKHVYHIKDKQEATRNYIYSIAEDKQHNLWIGTYGGGLSKFLLNDHESYHQKVNFSLKDGLSSDYVWPIFKDSKGHLWIGTDNGISKFDGKSFTNYTLQQGISNKQIYAITESENGDIWIGTDGGGINVFSQGKFSHYTQQNGLVNDFVNCLYTDKNGLIWIGTDDGLSIFNGKRFTNFTEKDGLCNNMIMSIVCDKNQQIWVATTNGLNCIQNYDLENHQLEVFTFHKENGLKSESFTLNTVLSDSKNRMWWGNDEALLMLDLNRFEFNKAPPKIQLNAVLLSGEYIDYLKLQEHQQKDSVQRDLYEKIHFDEVQAFYNFPKNLSLPHQLNHLTFMFNAVDWSAPSQLKYQYKLEGLDQEWSQLTTENKADYRNIPYGNYTFKVRAIGFSQKWSDVFEFKFTINPPWWSTWWAYMLYAVFAVLLIFAIVWLNGRRLRARAKELTHRISEATLELTKQKNVIQESYKEITDSINYAERIQHSFLATRELLDKNLKDYFIFFQPKAIVSGDFYWGTELNNGFAFVTADSTGHGVPGAIMSILNISSLELAVKENLQEPADILNYTRKEIIDRLKKDGGKDGMDASLIVLNSDKTKMNYAAANNPIWVVRNQEMIELKGDRMPIGSHDKENIPFSQKSFDLKAGDVIYTITDGFPDQFGGDQGKKFKSKQLKELLLTVSTMDMATQKETIERKFNKWKGDLEQVDDVTIIGIKIN